MRKLNNLREVCFEKKKRKKKNRVRCRIVEKQRKLEEKQRKLEEENVKSLESFLATNDVEMASPRARFEEVKKKQGKKKQKRIRHRNCRKTKKTGGRKHEITFAKVNSVCGFSMIFLILVKNKPPASKALPSKGSHRLS